MLKLLDDFEDEATTLTTRLPTTLPQILSSITTSFSKRQCKIEVNSSVWRKFILGKPYHMDCRREIDEKGRTLCGEWAASTLFLWISFSCKKWCNSLDFWKNIIGKVEKQPFNRSDFFNILPSLQHPFYNQTSAPMLHYFLQEKVIKYSLK